MSAHKDGLYHIDVYMPFDVVLPKVVRPIYTQHAKKAAENDKYGYIHLPNAIITAQAKIVEVELKNGSACKLVFRIAYNETHDLVIVMTSDAYIKTVWLNSKQDTHKTLSKGAYIAKVS